MNIPLKQMTTQSGAFVRLFDGAGWPGLGRGVMLMIDMPYGDGRHAEVFLDEDSAEAVLDGLQIAGYGG